MRKLRGLALGKEGGDKNTPWDQVVPTQEGPQDDISMDV